MRRVSFAPDGSLKLRWTRRARGAWEWLDEVETPLAEQSEAYRIGIGPVLAPVAVWDSTVAEYEIDPLLLDQLAAENPGAAVWVRQVGNYAQSDALLLAVLK